MGEAIGRNPGYLKLRKIRAAQNISRTVSFFYMVFFNEIHTSTFFLDCEFPKQSLPKWKWPNVEYIGQGV